MHAPVAIGIPVFNGEKWLRFTVESLLNQTFTNLDVVILDNASTDATASICAQLCRQDTRLRYFRNDTNIGVFRNFDAVFRLTGSRYFKWASVGDSCHPSFIDRAYEILERDSDVVLVHSRTGFLGNIPDDPTRFRADAHLISDDPVVRLRQFFQTVNLNHPFHGLIRTAALAKTSLNMPFRNSDMCLIGDLALKGKFFELPEDLLFRRMHVDTATALKSEEELKAFFAFEADDPNLLWRWKTEIGVIDAVRRATLTRPQRTSVARYLFTRLFWGRNELTSELLSYLRPRQ